MNHETTPLSAHCGETDCAEPIVARGVCRVHYLRAWRAKTLDELPTTRVERVECPADHPHDLTTCYEQHNCRCDGCRDLRKKERQRRRAQLTTLGSVDEIRGERVPAEPVRDHLTELMAHARLERIAEAAGLARSTITNIYHGPRGTKNRKAGIPPHTVHASIAEVILAITPERIETPYKDPTGTVRRLQALVAIGYSQTELAARLSIPAPSLNGIVLGKRARVSSKTYNATFGLFVELWAHPVVGTAGDRPRALAKSHGWVGPLAWDDIDDPTEVANVVGVRSTQIDEIAVELAMKGVAVKLTHAERRVAVTRLHAERWSDKRIAAALHIADRTVLRIRQRLGLEAFDFSEIRQVDSA